MTMAKNLGTCHEYKCNRRIMLRYQRISVAFLSFKFLLNDKLLLVVSCSLFSKLRANAKLCSGISCVILSKFIKLVEGCLYQFP